jgi:probable rRNA maturation factor
MQIEIRVHRKFSSRVQSARLARVARKTLRADASRADVSLTLYITNDAEIRKLNRQFHATDTPTDVLSFPTNMYGRSAERPYIGDIIISYERARVQARAARWRIADELDLLAVHGILHLLGYDDLAPRARAKMWKRQAEILGNVAGGE